MLSLLSDYSGVTLLTVDRVEGPYYSGLRRTRVMFNRRTLQNLEQLQ